MDGVLLTLIVKNRNKIWIVHPREKATVLVLIILLHITFYIDF